MNTFTRIDIKLNEISEILLSFKHDSSNYGLMNGTAGIVLFLLNYSRTRNSQIHLSKAFSLVEEIFENLSFESFKFSTGLSGLGWLMEYINEHEFSKLDTEELFEDADEYIYNWMLQEARKGNYDFLHGALGAGLYFYKRKKSKWRDKALTALTNTLIELAVEEGNLVKWPKYDFRSARVDQEVFDLGLSHGIPSILTFLSLMNSEFTELELGHTITKGVKFVNAQRNPPHSNSIYPYRVAAKPGVETSRLAWCYGDLSIACSLWNLGEGQLENEFSQQSIEILKTSTARNELYKNRVFDAGFCHGSAGIAHIYNKMYRNTGIQEFRKAADFWIEKTLIFSCYDDGLAGFKSFQSAFTSLDNDSSFLEGIAGIGLSLLSYRSQADLGWDESLLLLK